MEAPHRFWLASGLDVWALGSEENPLTREGPHTGSQEAAYLSSRARSDFGGGVTFRIRNVDVS